MHDIKDVNNNTCQPVDWLLEEAEYEPKLTWPAILFYVIYKQIVKIFYTRSLLNTVNALLQVFNISCFLLF